MESDATTVAEERPSTRCSAGAALKLALDQRRTWVAATAAPVSPPRSSNADPSTPPVPLRLVVHRLLEEWGVESTDSEDDDDFCGWRVGSRALPLPEAADRSSTSKLLPAGGFGTDVHKAVGRGAGASAVGGGTAVRSSSSAHDRRLSDASSVSQRSSGRPPGTGASRTSCALQ